MVTERPTPPLPLELAKELLAIYGSPLYVYQGASLRHTIQHITQAVPYPHTCFCFASVTNGNVSLLQIVRDEGWGLHANTPGDIYLGLQAGFHPSKIVYSGSNLNRAEMEQVLRCGLHFYRGTGTNATIAFTQVMDTVVATAQQLPEWEYLDFGGGFGYPYHHGGAAFSWKLFGTELTERLNQLERPVNLIVEPGRAAIAECATLLAQVVSVKWQDSKQIVGVDTTVANLSVPSVHGGYREIVPLIPVQMRLASFHLTDVCGNTTYSRDYLGRNCQLPELEIGDILAVLDVGAYGYAMSSHFLHRPRPAEVLIENDSHRPIRKREDYSVLLENQVF